MNERIEKLLKERHCLTSHDRYGDSHPDDYYHMYREDIDELIELIRNDEREACALLCDAERHLIGICDVTNFMSDEVAALLNRIRTVCAARGET